MDDLEIVAAVIKSVLDIEVLQSQKYIAVVGIATSIADYLNVTRDGFLKDVFLDACGVPLSKQ